jgi:hypothetical protein
MFASTFPYINPPLAGSPNDLSVNITMQQSPNVVGPYANTAATYNSATGQIATAPTGSATGFYRAQTDLPGVQLGTPTVTSTNVLIGVKVP